MEVLILIPVIGLSLGWQHWQNTTAASAMLHTVSAMILFLFVASLPGLLMPATVVLIACGTAVAVIECIRHVRQRIVFPVPIGIFGVLGVTYWLVQSDSLLYFYDEYSHWGVYLREMLAHDNYWGSDTNALHPRYLPGATLWQYVFARFSARPEGAAYLAQFTLLITPLLAMWENIRWRDYWWHAGVLVVVVVTLTNFGHGLTSLYVDHLLGAWFIGILLNYLLEMRARSVVARLSYLLPLVLVLLIKTTGVFFVLADAGIIGLLLLLGSPGTVARGSSWRSAVVFPVAAVILCLSVLAVWNVNRDAAGVASGEGSAVEIVTHLAAGESIFDNAQQEELTRRYIEVIFHQQISKSEVSIEFNAFSYPTMRFYTDRFRLTTASLLGLTFIALFLIWRNIIAPQDRPSWAIAAGCVWLTAVAYIFVLYFGYRFISATANGLILSSYIRYAHSMLLPLVIFCFATLLPAFAKHEMPMVRLGEKLSVQRHSLAFSVALVALVVFEPPYLQRLFVPQAPPEFRVQTEPLTSRVRAKIGEASLWVLFPSEFSNGLLGHVLQYQLTPGRTYVELDAGEIFDRQPALKKELRNWEYAWFPTGGSELDAAIAQLIGFPPTERLYRIDAGGTELRFVPVAGVFLENTSPK